MVSWQAFPSLPPRAPLAFLSHLKLPRPENSLSLPFQTPATQAILKTSNQVYMPVFSQFGEIVWQRLFNIARILQTTALNILMTLFHILTKQLTKMRIKCVTWQIWPPERNKEDKLKHLRPILKQRLKQLVFPQTLEFIASQNNFLVSTFYHRRCTRGL